MKFGKYLASRQLELPEYSGNFIDYKALKKLIKHLANPATASSTSADPQAATATQSEIHAILKENKASFFFRVERELEKVNSFYLEKQANLAITLNLLLLKKAELLSKATIDYADGDDGSPDFRNSISYLNLYQNFKKTHQDLIRLQQFIELNETGFSKVVKKWDKRSKSHTKELFIQSAVNVQPVFHHLEINDLSDQVTQSLFDLESILDGDYSSLSAYTGSPTTTTNTAPKSQDYRALVSDSSNYRIDDLYSSFVNLATIKDPDHSLLAQWVDKVRATCESASDFAATYRMKLSQILLLSISNLKISDLFLMAFLETIKYEVDFKVVSDDLNNNKTILHQCCSIPPASAQEHHITINNGVKVINSTDSILHSRNFIVEYMMKMLLKDSSTLLVCKDYNGHTCLHYAAQSNRLDLIDNILPYFPTEHIDDIDNDSMTPLLLAIKYGHLDVVKRLLQAGSKCFPKADKITLQYLPFGYACRFGDYDTVEYLLSYSDPGDRERIHQQDVEGLLPLHVVSRLGHHELIKLLIDHGADVNKTDGLNDWTPLLYAAMEGHVEVARELVKHGARVDIVDNDGFDALYYCAIEGNIAVLNEMLSHQSTLGGHSSGMETFSRGSSSGSDSDKLSTVGADGDPKLMHDGIPDLQLPPPVLPLRRYGHNFLEKKVLVELEFESNADLIVIFDLTGDLNPGRITLTSNISDIVPRNVILPIDSNAKNSGCVFQTEWDALRDFRIDFEVFPKFGTRLIAKTTALTFSHMRSTTAQSHQARLPLFDKRLRNIGELRCKYQVIFPFLGALLETSKFDTYWKASTSYSGNGLKLNATGGMSPRNFLNREAQKQSSQEVSNGVTSSPTPFELTRVVTTTSLSGEYIRLKVCPSSDGTPIVCPRWLLAISDSIELYVPNLTYEELSSLTNQLFDYSTVLADLNQMTSQDILSIKKLLKIIYLPLEQVLSSLSSDIKINLEFVFPSRFELRALPFAGNIEHNLNSFIDNTMNDIFTHVRSTEGRASHGSHSRSIIFLSANPSICKILNWKQPNFPVFLVMNGMTFSQKTSLFESRLANGLVVDNLDYEQAKTEVTDATTRSIKDAVKFTINNNLIGLIVLAHLLKLVPQLVPLIKSRGLVLVASSFSSETECDRGSLQDLDGPAALEGVSGLRFDDVMQFRGDITMKGF